MMIKLVFCFLGLLGSLAADDNQSRIPGMNYIPSQGNIPGIGNFTNMISGGGNSDMFPGISSIPGASYIPGISNNKENNNPGSKAGGNSQEQKIVEFMMDYCTWRTIANMAQLVATQQKAVQQSKGKP